MAESELQNRRNLDNMASFNAYGVAELSDGQRVNIQMTMRHGMSAEVTLKDFGEYLKFLNIAALEHGVKFDKAPPQAPAPTASPAVQKLVAEGEKPAAAALQAAIEDIGEPPAGKQWFSVDVQEVHIIPQVDGMVKVEFWNPGRQYPEETTKWKPESIAGLLKHVTSADTGKAQKLTLPCRVFFTLGKEYAKKSGEKANYHDIAHVRAIP